MVILLAKNSKIFEKLAFCSKEFGFLTKNRILLEKIVKIAQKSEFHY